MLKKLENKLNKKLIVFGTLTIITLIIYSNSFMAQFTLDDFGNIVNNSSIRFPWDFPSLWKFYSNRVIIYFTFSINYFFHQTEEIGYHIVNVLIHILNSIIVYLIINNILSLKHFFGKLVYKYRNTISLFSALVFATHPVQVNAVTYIVQRTASLAAMFYFLAILFFIKYRLTDKVRNILLTLLFIVLAMFTKENTITIPFMLILIEFLFFLKDGRTTWKKRIVVILILLITLPIIPATNVVFHGYSQSDPGVSFKASTSMPRDWYFYTQMNVIVHYIRLLFIPDRLNFDYSNDYPISHNIWENGSYISFGILLLIGLFSLLNLKKNKLTSFGIMWFFIGLAVESSFISIKDVYFEHRLYFPIVGFAIFLIGMIFSGYRIVGRPYLFRKPLLFFVTFISIIIVMNSVLTLKRNYVFSDNIRLWSDVVEKAPLSDRGHCILATNYLNAYEDNKNNKDYLLRAEEEFKKAIELNSRNDTAHCNLAKVYYLKGDYQKCIDEGNETNKISRSEYAFFNIGLAYDKLNQPDKALSSYLSGYWVNGKCTFILKALGNAYEVKKDFVHAEFYYEKFLEYNDYSDSKEIKKKLEEIRKNK
ncbi:MAG: tetratricopeptide repeat protein [Clostridia bacterium]|nr:tetratricopeptide repeat protein [Clostridia bacterium]